MNALTEFFAMGGYAPYVWGSYALALIIFIYNAWVPLRRHARLRSAIRADGRRDSAAVAAPTHRIHDENSP
ncbi:MAG TPA: heme exporter protein CcmD [Candidatus Macondimonas sp.]|nr:heme exporter protein CcmD [Candidatus Macondimonas sp.]